MNTQIINAELVLALRKCLPFVKRHAIISGGDGSLTYSFAVRALADADARQREQEAVKNIAEAERTRQIDAACTFTVTKAMARANEAREAEASYWRNRYPPPAKLPGQASLRQVTPAKRCDCSICRIHRVTTSTHLKG